VKLVLSRSGGIAAAVPALAKDIVLDTGTVGAATAQEIHALVSAVDFTQAGPPPARGAADHISYTLTLTHDDEESAVTFHGPIPDPALSRLVVRLEEFGRSGD
jgi:hypothetical protein